MLAKFGLAPQSEDRLVTRVIGLPGDNRQHSRDSRWRLGDPGGGSVPLDDVVGTAFAVVLPLDRASLLRNPGDVFADVPDPA